MRFRIVIIIFLISYLGYSQEDAWIYFNDKPNSQFYFDNPLQMLSQRALDRRTTQNISLDIKDVPIHQPYIDQITASFGITVKAQSKWMNALHIRGTQADIAALAGLLFVDHIEYANHSLNFRIAVGPDINKNSQKKFQNILVNYNYGTSATQIQMLNGHILHQQDYTGTGKIIAIMDAGFPGVNTAAPFQRLFSNNLILGGYDFVARTNNPYVGFQHGTQVLSTMGGFVDGQLVGTAPNASYYLFRTEDAATENPIEESNWVEAAELADSLGVDVINTSLGYFEYDNPAYNYTYTDMNGVTSFISRGANIAFSRGMICVTSAGNSGGTSDPFIGVPADALTTLTVGAVTGSEIRGSFSSIGPTSDGRIKPDVMAMGVAATVATETGVITTNSGTSFSGPILAGALTSFWSAFPWFTNAEVIQLVKQSADRFTIPDNMYGYGIPDFQLALNMALLEVNQNSVTNIKVYPNPVKESVTISVPENIDTFSIQFYNSIGQNVFTQNSNNSIQNISLQALPSGIYFYKIDAANTVKTGKLIKQ
ncbi:S8 family serine peptidase [Flavobacterium sp. GT3R68]|uniref:S8 family serine peptidase n=1 Tax=Flavobacterium sp. GT3R68 TaxID=2594437 RepID=UPI000F881170|nr:S8 family serine peptidase [Flavobacterium sp. GT3R68]RTY95327.1 T9SS type A sorting domain-containing protein [Flavobacterium sp. GSN2]TRW90933.1 S8 family serine peptidase [Flavobacterium sp. GT3R68]